MNANRLLFLGLLSGASQIVKRCHQIKQRKSLSARLLLPCALCLVLAAAVAGCADADIPQPSSPMTRADSIAAGLLPAVVTADGAWDSETYYDFDGNPLPQLGVGSTDTDAEKAADGHTYGE